MTELLKADGTEAAPAEQQPHCPAVWCDSKEVGPGRPFCPEHLARVPHHLRRAIAEEFKWLKQKKLAMDQHTVNLIIVAINREIAMRIVEDPATREKWEAYQAEQASLQKAREAGLLLPPSAGELVVASPKGPTP